MKKLLKFSPIAALVILPGVVSAQAGGGIFGFLDLVAALIGRLVPIVIGLAVLVFLWGVLQYVVAKDSDKQKEARNVMVWGVIALFVMVSVWGLVNVLSDSLNLDTTGPDLPAVPR